MGRLHGVRLPQQEAEQVARGGARLPVKEWKVSTDPDPRREGGILCGDGNPIMPHMWPTFDQIVTALNDRNESALAHDGARATEVARIENP